MNNLSILIPIYNFDCRELVYRLHDQCESLKINYEIICIDDSSTLFFAENASMVNISNVKFIGLNKNIGRSKIRNLLAKEAKGEYLIFMDCDSMIDDDFVCKYIDNIDDIVVGGRLYLDSPPADSKYYFHWKYGSLKEPKPSDSDKPFTSNNFLISKILFNSVRFDENITGYGHEDTIFGIEIKNKNIRIAYIYNPVYHIGLSANEQFLSNSRNAIENLSRISLDLDMCSIDDIRILKYYKIIRRFGITFLFAFAYTLMRENMEANLLGKEPSMFVFNIYKLCYLCNLKWK